MPMLYLVLINFIYSVSQLIQSFQIWNSCDKSGVLYLDVSVSLDETNLSSSFHGVTVSRETTEGLLDTVGSD